MTEKKKSFENSLNDLEKIVRKLEDGDLSLEESLKLFEDGVKLSRECRERLTDAERRIEILLKNEKGEILLQNLDAENLREDSRPKVKKRIVFEDEGDEETTF